MQQPTFQPDPRRKQMLMDMITRQSLPSSRPEKSLQAQLDALQQDLLQKDEELAQKGKKKFNLDEHINRICNLALQYEDELKIKNKQIEDLQLHSAQLEMELSSFQEMKEHCDNAIKQLHHVEMQMNDVQEQNQQLKCQEQQYLSQIQALQKNSDTLLRDAFEREKKQLHKKLLEKSKIIQELHGQIQKQNEMQSTLHQSMMKMKDDQRKQDHIIEQLRQEIENLKGDPQMKLSLQLQEYGSPMGQRMASFNTHNDLDTPVRPQQSTYQKPSSSNSLCSNFTSQESKKKMMGNFKKLTTMAVGMYSNFLDYQSLQNGSKLAQELSQARLDLTQSVSRQQTTNGEFHDNN